MVNRVFGVSSLYATWHILSVKGAGKQRSAKRKKARLEKRDKFPNLPHWVLRWADLTAPREFKSPECVQQIICKNLDTLSAHTAEVELQWEEGRRLWTKGALPASAVPHCQTAQGILLSQAFKGPLLS